MITQHLLQIGHQAIGFVAGPATSYSGNQRLKGYKKALADANIDFHPGWVHHCLPTTASGEETTNLLLKANPELSALFCYNDLVALGALRHCAVFGYQVPADIAVTGYDDIMLAGVVTPSLTTCHVPRVELGSQAVSMLLNCINDETEPCNEIVIMPKLVIRASTVGGGTAVSIQR
jgi:LacI family transcriptional regulator